MTPRIRLVGGILSLFLCTTQIQKAAAPPDPDKDPQAPRLLQDARALIKGKRLPEAIEKCDRVIAAFNAHYEGRKEKIYCARTSAESLGYLLKAASDKVNAISLSATWADAYFIKAYALQDLGRFAEAKATLKLALDLSPMSSHYLSELGNIYQAEKNWSKAEESFAAAEDNAPISPDDVKAEELGRARRGLAYVFVEQGRLAEAEKKYQQCLAADPKDTKAAQELEYVRGLRAKTKAR
jgi:tetratricopeptide (TPR) repeat protein